MNIKAWGAVLFCSAVLVADPAYAADEFSLLLLDGRQVKWGAPTLGAGAVVTYSFARERMEFPAARNCRTIVPIDQLLARSNLSRDAFVEALGAASRMWTAVAQIDFVYTDDPVAADLVIGAQGAGVGWAFADVTRGEAPIGAIAGIHRAAICFNPERSWKIGFDGNLDVFDMGLVLAHELGHVIGLDHPDPSGQIMSFSYDEKVSELQAGDIAAAVRLYGARLPHRATSSVDAPQAGCVGGTKLAVTALGERPRVACGAN